MSVGTEIEWCDATWSPVVGCTPVSAGCLNCYAATMARRHVGMGTPGYEDRDGIRIAETRGGRAVFTGSVRCIEDRLAEPLHWRKPRRIFVCSMADLFHAAVPFDHVDRVFAVAALCPQHQFLVLTKRPERMAEYLLTGGKIGDRYQERECHVGLTAMGMVFDDHAVSPESTLGRGVTLHREGELVHWPLPNVWLGTSVEHQAAADERIPHLLRCPAAVRFLSVEPLLGPVDLNIVGDGLDDAGRDGPSWSSGIHLVIVGGESGPKARPCDVGWIRSVVRHCADAAVPCFVKQLGARPVIEPRWDATGKLVAPTCSLPLVDPKGGDPSEWPADLRVRQMPEVRS